MRVSSIAVYPVKSLAAFYPDHAELVQTGFQHDRAWMIVGDDGSFITQRQHPWMARVLATVESGVLHVDIPQRGGLRVPIVADGPAVRVTVWNTVCQAIDQGDHVAAALSDYLERSCRLVRMHPSYERSLGSSYTKHAPTMAVGFADSSPLMLVGAASLLDLNARLTTPVTMDRFRPNLVIEGAPPFAEDGWKRIRVGSVELHVVKDCIRCQIPNVDQSTGERGIEPMETLERYRASARGTRFGRKVVHAGVGTIRVGDAVEILE